MEHYISWEVLAKYFAGELSERKEDEMERWIKADPGRERAVQKLYEVWNESGDLPYELDVEESWDLLSENMDKLDRKIESTNRVLSNKQDSRSGLYSYKTGRKIHQMMVTAVAAAVLIIAGLFAYSNYGVTNEEPVELGRMELVAQDGERATYLLNDGSKIVLHAGSRLEVPLQFNNDKRELFLVGEAYFEVNHNPEKPFIVHSEGAYTRVLGTKFLVQSWPDASDQIEVVVTEGKVALGSSKTDDRFSGNEAIIEANQKGVLSGDKTAVISGADMEWYMGWTRGQLKFDNRSFEEIIPKLERWYNLDITLEDKELGNLKLTAEIDYSQPMSEVLKGIAMTLDLEVQKTGRVITYRPEMEE